MRAIRIGNDVAMECRVFANGAEYPLEGRDLRVVLRCGSAEHVVKEFAVSGNVLRFTYWGMEQRRCGTWFVTLVENEGERGMYTVDSCDAFRLVPRSACGGVDGELDFPVGTLELSMEVETGGFVTGSYEELEGLPTLNGETIVGDKVSADYGLLTHEEVDRKLDEMSLAGKIKAEGETLVVI